MIADLLLLSARNRLRSDLEENAKGAGGGTAFFDIPHSHHSIPFLALSALCRPPPHAPSALCHPPPTSYRLLDADGCLRSDGVADSPRFASLGLGFVHVIQA